MSAVQFDLDAFRARYPEFANKSPELLRAYFTEAGLYCNNTDNSRIRDLAVRGMILNMIVAHIAELNTTPVVGRVSSLNIVGAMSASSAYASPEGSRAWFDQTRYGAAAWQAMGPYRGMVYVTG